MRLSLVSAVVLGLTSAVLGAPQHRKHSPCTKNNTGIGSQQATPSVEVKGQFIGLPPTTTTTATATSPPPGEEKDQASPTPTGPNTQLDAQIQKEKQSPTTTSCTGKHGPKDAGSQKEQPNSTPPPESTPQKSAMEHFTLLKPTTTPPPASSPLPEKGSLPESSPVSLPTPESTPDKKTTGFLVQPDGSDISDICLKTHNKYRAIHSAPALTWDQDLATFAQQYAASQDCSVLQHSQKHPENLCSGYSSFEGCMQGWYDEVNYYTYDKPWEIKGNPGKEVGHFTQMVWKAATKIGCAQKQCVDGTDKMGYYHICDYDVGNVHWKTNSEEESKEEEYKLYIENVLPPTGK